MNNTLKSSTTSPEPMTFMHKIGSTMFQVTVRFDEAGKEFLEEKILRMMKNDLKNPEKGVIMSKS
ncbi:transposon-encoded TnpW family protein [Lachnospiraceae bacterium ZAX-1]